MMNDILNSLIEVKIEGEESFLKIKETLTRIALSQSLLVVSLQPRLY